MGSVKPAHDLYTPKIRLMSEEHGQLGLLPEGRSPDSTMITLEHASDLCHVRVKELSEEQFSIVQWELRLKKDMKLMFIIDEPLPELFMQLDDQIHYAVEGGAREYMLRYQYNMFYLHQKDFYLVSDRQYVFLTVHFKADYLQQWENIHPLFSAFLDQIKKHQPVTLLSHRHLPVTPAMLSIIAELFGQTILHKMIREIKVMELVNLSLITLSANSDVVMPDLLQEKDLVKIEQARVYLTENMHKPVTLPSVARYIGLNEKKLKTGFKYVYGTTVFNLLTEERMQRALMLLKNRHRKDLSVTNIALAVGYKNRSNFSFAFRRYFGYKPTEVKLL